MASFLPPSFDTAIFNTNAFNSGGYITKAQADRLYLSIASGRNLPLIDGIAPGTASPDKALIFDSGPSIVGINALGASTVTIGGVTVTSAQAAYLSPLVPGTASGSKALVVDSGRNIVNVNNLGITTLSIGALSIDSSDLQYIDGITPGTAQASKALVLDASRNLTWDGNITMSNTSDSIVISNSNSSGRSNLKMISDSNTVEFGLRGSAASNSNTVYLYAAGAYKMIMNMTGDFSILSTTDSTSASTGSFKLSGGLGVSKNIWTDGQLKVNNATSHISLLNPNSGGSSLIELAASPNILRLVRGFAVNIGTSGVRIQSASVADPRCSIDMGADAGLKICLFAASTPAAGLYGISANNSSFECHSPGTFRWIANSTLTSTTVGYGSERMILNNSGDLLIGRNTNVNAGIHSYGFDSSGLNSFGYGTHMHFASGKAQLFGYSYSENSYATLSLNGGSIQCFPIDATNLNQRVTINSPTSTSGIAPLAVFGTTNFSRLTSFGYLAQSGSGTASGFSNRPFTIYSEGGIICTAGEIDVFSDVRLKEDISGLKLEEAMRFLELEPISFKYKNQIDSKLHYSYRAQDFIRKDIQHIVGLTDINGDPLEPEDITCDDGRVFHLPGDAKLVINLQQCIPLLHLLIKDNRKKVMSSSDMRRENSLRPLDNPLARLMHIPVYEQGILCQDLITAGFEGLVSKTLEPLDQQTLYHIDGSRSVVDTGLEYNKADLVPFLLKTIQELNIRLEVLEKKRKMVRVNEPGHGRFTWKPDDS
jgi:hypothetical protein